MVKKANEGGLHGVSFQGVHYKGYLWPYRNTYILKDFYGKITYVTLSREFCRTFHDILGRSWC